jgi:hypothetical protein
MIGVKVSPREQDLVSEFFELFKTPWEIWRGGRRYEVVLCLGGADVRDAEARLVVAYGGGRLGNDSAASSTVLSYKGNRIPIYGETQTFEGQGAGVLRDERDRRWAGRIVKFGERTVVDVGYDLMREILTLLTIGQPTKYAELPTMELHIGLLRDLIVEHTDCLVEIPPVPESSPFIACLTHDVDHALFRRHKWDHTMLGFLYRASVGSLFNMLRGRMSFRKVLTNWAAAASLPLIHTENGTDLWAEFDRYIDFEGDAKSTFFIIPFKARPGRTARGTAPEARSARYEARDILDRIQRLEAAGCEIGVHGIDAWLDSARGREELEEIAAVTKGPGVGIRMHWLYCDEASAATLESAGFEYDSTVGYNETIGYRAGTTQVFRPFGARELLELPLHVMDTALFYPRYLDLSPREARDRVRGILDVAVRFGGAVTINWHDRSIAPERLWGDSYATLLEDLRREEPWFATARQAVTWFRKRRAARFEAVSIEGGMLHVRVTVEGGQDVPGLRLRVHRRAGMTRRRHEDTGGYYLDSSLARSSEIRMPL